MAYADSEERLDASEWIPTEAPVDEARRIIADCTDARGRLGKPELHHALTTLVRQRNKYMERLGLLQPLQFKDVSREPTK